MKNTEYNQALVKKAQAGLIRFQGMQKRSGLFDDNNEASLSAPVAPSKATPESLKDSFDVLKTPITHNPDTTNVQVDGTMNVKPEESPASGSSKATNPPLQYEPTNPYLRYAVGGAGVGALVGTLISLVRNKSLLGGALGGALIGSGLGAGHKYLMDNNDTYGNWENNPIESGFQSGFKTYDDLMAKLK